MQNVPINASIRQPTDPVRMPKPTKNRVLMSRIGTWNVRSVKNKENEVIREMKRYNIDVLGLSETKARGNGMKAVDGASYVYSGVTEGRAKRGVAIIVAERWADCVRSWRCVNMVRMWRMTVVEDCLGSVLKMK